MKCPKCGDDCGRDEVDVGVGVIHGPYGCSRCGWSESEKYDLSEGQDPVDDKGGAFDQYGGYYPSGSTMARAARLASKRLYDPNCSNCDGTGLTIGCNECSCWDKSIVPTKDNSWREK